MNVNKFGLHVYKLKKQKTDCIPMNCNIKLKEDGSLDVQNKILKNLKSPIDLYDSATKEYVDKSLSNVLNLILSSDALITELCNKINRLESKTKHEQNRRGK